MLGTWRPFLEEAGEYRQPPQCGKNSFPYGLADGGRWRGSVRP